MTDSFRAVRLEQVDKATRAEVTTLPADALPAGEVEIDVSHSTLNYKDALAITGAGKIVREFPFVPGIDFAGTVRSSADPRFNPGQEVFLTGWGVGERQWGGLAERARVKADWLLPKPEGLTLADTMAIGTAGFTAMLSVMAIEEQGVRPGDGEVVVTGAAGGVGSVAIPLLRRAGFAVVASTGRAALADYLTGLGAQRVVDRAQFSEGSKAPLDSAVWAGAVNSVGGTTLVNLLKGMRNHGVVTACGLAGGAAFEGTVFPFILRGVRLIGIDSAYFPADRRPAVWARLARDLDLGLLARMTRTIPLGEVPRVAPEFLAGKVQGRIVVDTRASVARSSFGSCRIA